MNTANSRANQLSSRTNAGRRSFRFVIGPSVGSYDEMVQALASKPRSKRTGAVFGILADRPFPFRRSAYTEAVAVALRCSQHIAFVIGWPNYSDVSDDERCRQLSHYLDDLIVHVVPSMVKAGRRLSLVFLTDLSQVESWHESVDTLSPEADVVEYDLIKLTSTPLAEDSGRASRADQSWRQFVEIGNHWTLSGKPHRKYPRPAALPEPLHKLLAHQELEA